MEHRAIRRILAARFAALSDFPWTTDQPRAYQADALKKVAAWADDPGGLRRTHVKHATGLGKTNLFSFLLAPLLETDLQSLIIVPKKVLVSQTVKRIHHVTGAKLGFHAGMKPIALADGEVLAIRGHHGQQIVVTTDQSFKARAEAIAQEFAPHFVVADECHWLYTDKAQKALGQIPEAAVFACSATPDYLSLSARRGSVPALMDNGLTLYGDPERFATTHFGDLLDERSLRWGIKQGWLAPLAWGHIELDISLNDLPVVKTQVGLEYRSRELQQKLHRNWPLVCDTVSKLYLSGQYDLANRQTIAVCPSVAAAKELAQSIQELGVPAAWIAGTTSNAEREQILAAFERGQIKFLTSVRVLREGWDAPNAEVALMLTPTRSRVLYVQFMGRVLRPQPGKVALVIDAFFRNTELAPLSTPVLFGDPVEGSRRVRDGGLLISGPGGGTSGSPYLPPGVEPRLVIVQPAEVGWVGKRVFYETIEEASEAARSRKIADYADYRSRREEDPHLPFNPRVYYGKEAWESVGGWSGFLGGKKRVPKYKEIQRASSAARLLEIADYADYRSRRTADPRLPSNPLDYYGKEAWESIGGWDGFLNRVTKYPTIEKASQASRRLGVSSWTEYCRRYKEDPLLPSVPSRFYGKEAWESIGGWDGFLNRVTKYPTIQEASQAVQSLGIIDYADYRSRREKDPRLPGNPWHYFGKEAWGLIGGWPGFLGRKPKKKG